MSKQLMKAMALAEAALRAGCPILQRLSHHPQTEILRYLAKRMDEVGGTFVQTESSSRASTCSSARRQPARVRPASSAGPASP